MPELLRWRRRDRAGLLEHLRTRDTEEWEEPKGRADDARAAVPNFAN